MLINKLSEVKLLIYYKRKGLLIHPAKHPIGNITTTKRFITSFINSTLLLLLNNRVDKHSKTSLHYCSEVFYDRTKCQSSNDLIYLCLFSAFFLTHFSDFWIFDLNTFFFQLGYFFGELWKVFFVCKKEFVQHIFGAFP